MANRIRGSRETKTGNQVLTHEPIPHTMGMTNVDI